MVKSKLIVTTTPNVDGWEIESYLGPISAHIVAGTGFFSDFAASFSDVFGGRSQTYQRQLSAINNEVIDALKTKASLLGANCIVGLKIDHDEISGKSKQMFMVTAYGTAVRAIQLKSHKTLVDKNTVLISSDDLVVSLKVYDIIKKTRNVPFYFSEEEQNFVIENQVFQIGPSILKSLEAEYIRIQNTGTGQPNTNFERRYFLSLPSEIAIQNLYDSITRNDQLAAFVADTIIKGDLFDYPSILKLLSTNNFKLQKRALSLCQANKTFYSYDDLEMFAKLIGTIESTFIVRAKDIEQKSLLSSNVKQKWQCECGTKNEKDLDRCSNCAKDIYGFYTNEPNPVFIIQLLKKKIHVLKNTFAL